MQITSASELKHRFAGIIWGDSKCGKTTYAASLPGYKLVINFDPDGFTSLSHRNDFDVLDLSSLSPTDAIKQAQKVGTYILANPDKYQSVIVDSLTTLTEASLLDAIYRGVGKSAKFTPSLDAPGLTGYGARNTTVNDVISKILRATSQIGAHCFFLAHADDPEFEETGKTIMRQTIMLSSKIRNNVGLKVSEIWHMASTTKRVIYTAPFGVKTPMGSRIFDTNRVKQFDLNYSYDKSDEEQPSSLLNIFKAWEEGGKQKLLVAPK